MRLDPRDPWWSVGSSKALTTEGTEDHRGNRRLIDVDLHDSLHWVHSETRSATGKLLNREDTENA